MRLFRAWSIVDDLRGRDPIRMDWFVVGRNEPLAPWEELIRDYDESDENAAYDQILANELLTEDETLQLKSYLAAEHNLDLQFEEVKLPIKSGGLSFGLLLISGEKEFYALADEEGYPLDIAILGHYDCQPAGSPRLLSAEELAEGIEFLQMIFKASTESGADLNALQEGLQEVYTVTGLRVTRDQ